MKNLLFALLTSILFASCAVKKSELNVKEDDVERIIKTLASDEMQGRGLFSPGIERAAQFIEAEYRAIGLQPLTGLNNFRQEIPKTRISPEIINVSIEGSSIPSENVLIISDRASINWTKEADAEIHRIGSGQSFMNRYREILALNKPVIVLVDNIFFDAFKRLRDYNNEPRFVDELNQNKAAVFILGSTEPPKGFSINFSNKIEKALMYNIVGVIPGKSRVKEQVIFSGHYDHLGIMEASQNDSIANGADDDASGVTAVISLAKHYKTLGNNERTLIFAAFTAEEIGLVGSKYFSDRLNPEEVVAMFNIEMIGKQSKFGRNSAFITGYDKSDFGQILQKNLTGTGFTFHPDPYQQQNLFYRSDNASLAALGVPAHTISTVQIDKDNYYHTVDDELSTLDVSNIEATIKAIALSSRSIVMGIDTPKRIPPLTK